MLYSASNEHAEVLFSFDFINCSWRKEGSQNDRNPRKSLLSIYAFIYVYSSIIDIAEYLSILSYILLSLSLLMHDNSGSKYGI